LAPRWRALLTWVGFAVLAGAVTNWVGFEGFNKIYEGFENLVNLISPVRVSREYMNLVMSVNLFLAWIWYEPVVLRLNLVRGAAWLILRVTQLWSFGSVAGPGDNGAAAVIGILAIAGMVPVLWNWRSRPWMPLVGSTLSFEFAALVVRTHPRVGFLFWVPIFSLPVAVVMLYGTRRLRPEER
jgi:hypothetical protein